MAEILIKATDSTHPDNVKDQRWCYKRGYPVVVMPDGHLWGREERLPLFVVLKFPGVSIEKMKDYIQPEEEYIVNPLLETEITMVRRRQWQIQWNELPQLAKDKLKSAGELTIKSGDYNGPYDYTWKQVKGLFLNYKTGLRETVDI